jgi:RNA polymerase sigma-70 factor (ECF subfamily)
MGESGSPRSIERLVEEHYVSLYRYAFRLSGSAADAEDLTQETFCKAQFQLRQLRDFDRARAWLFRILRNVYLHRLRADRPLRWVEREQLEEVPEPSPPPLAEVEPAQLQAALTELPESFRTPIILYYFEDFSYRDIADHMDLPLGTVMSRLARAKAHLRERLRPGPALVADARRRASDGL